MALGSRGVDAADLSLVPGWAALDVDNFVDNSRVWRTVLRAQRMAVRQEGDAGRSMAMEVLVFGFCPLPPVWVWGCIAAVAAAVLLIRWGLHVFGLAVAGAMVARTLEHPDFFSRGDASSAKGPGATTGVVGEERTGAHAESQAVGSAPSETEARRGLA
jgi:hypothetical protein